MIITLRQSSSAGAPANSVISRHCGLCRLMKPVLIPNSVHLAFQWRLLDVPAENMMKPRTSVGKCLALRLLYTSFLAGLLTVPNNVVSVDK
ncbi:hypothetical protein T09_15771 [Trichinella sp. T9]|nr:hypothetical protein T09_15771 [Trichinella sp. T9]